LSNQPMVDYPMDGIVPVLKSLDHERLSKLARLLARLLKWPAD